jgi:hypothetical protein
MVLEVHIIVGRTEAHIFEAWAHTSEGPRTLQLGGGIEEVYVRLLHEVLQVLNFFFETFLAETLCHFELLLERCPVMLLRLIP